MRVCRIAAHLRRANNFRAKVGAYTEPIDLIQRPVGMRRARFQAIKARIEYHENKAGELFGLGLKKYAKGKTDERL
jgi:hypothetical protein